MNVIKVIRPTRNEPVKLIRTGPVTVQLVRPSAQPVQLINQKGVVIFGGSTQASQITTKTDFAALYNFKKQL